ADAPQTQFAYAVSLFPVEGFFFRAHGKTFASHYAEFDPFSRTGTDDRGEQSWQAPGYTVFDLHAAYRLGDILPAAGDLRLFANVYNLLDEIYVQDAVDNSRFNGFDGDHDADDAEVFLGIPRSFNLGFEVRF
ncbi:MAG: TonB-dependent receptor, partial [Longimicrobiales bacterium]